MPYDPAIPHGGQWGKGGVDWEWAYIQTKLQFKNTHAKISTIKISLLFHFVQLLVKTSFSFLKSVTFLVIEIKVFQCDSKLIIALISTTGNQLRD